MPTLDEYTSMDQIEAEMARLRALKRQFSKHSTVAERKIATLTRRRERLVAQLAEIDDVITRLRQEVNVNVTPPTGRRRGRRPKSALVNPAVTEQNAV